MIRDARQWIEGVDWVISLLVMTLGILLYVVVTASAREPRLEVEVQDSPDGARCRACGGRIYGRMAALEGE